MKAKKIELYGRLGGTSGWRAADLEAARKEFAKKAAKDIPENVMVHKAWMVMLVRRGVVGRERGLAILRALAAVDDAAVAGMVENFDPDYPKPIYQLENHLTNVVGDTASDVNLGRTIPPPFYRMAVREALLTLIDATLSFRSGLLDLAARHTRTVMPGYTHMQHAQPTTLGHYLMSLYDAVDRASDQVEAAYAQTNVCDMGCGACAGTSFDIDRVMVADFLGFDGIQENANDCVASTDHAVDAVCACTNLIVPLGRVANEMDVWHSFEFNMIEIADDMAAPSSMMPQKKNPAVFEYLRMTVAHVMSGYADIVGMAHGLPYGDVCDIKEISMRVCPTVRQVAGSLRSMQKVFSGLIVKPDIMLKRAGAGFSTASELAATLYREAGIPLRLAHGVVAEVVRQVWEDGGLAQAITNGIVDAAAEKVTGRPAGLSEASLARALDPTAFVEAHASRGGAAPEEVVRMIAERKKTLADAQTRHRDRLARLDAAAEKLDQAVDALIAQ
jgi:argininosuccinate lyase